MCNRLRVLEKSLEKKEAILSRKFQQHHADVAQANGQPLNDKRNGQATLRRWERQENSIRNAKKEIERTKNAIEKEKYKIADVAKSNITMPVQILSLVETGELIQWRKHPNTFFVKGVDKARIVWDDKTKSLGYRYHTDVKDQGQYKVFAQTFNALNKSLHEERT